MVKLKLARIGSPKRPSYRIIVMDSKKSPKSRYIDLIGSYRPLEVEESKKVILDEGKTLQWLREGAQPTDKVKVILKKAKIWQKFIEVKNQKEEKVNEAGY